MTRLFADRMEGGRRLAADLAALKLEQPVIYALPRGGVPVAIEVARALKAPLDLMIVRKIGAPGEPELALGALAEGPNAEVCVNETVRRVTGASDDYIEEARLRAMAEIERRRGVYLSGRARINPQGRTAVVVDDGLATGSTARAAARALRAEGASRVVIAAPVAPPETVAALGQDADLVVCTCIREDFYGVGQFYQDFHQLDDEEVTRLLAGVPGEPAN